jgi:hypothetical protein
VPARRRVRTYEPSVGRIAAIAIDSALREMVVGGADGAVAITDLQAGRSVVVRGNTGPIADLAFSHDGRRVVVLAHNGECEVWDVGKRRFMGRRRLLRADTPVFVAWRGDRVIAAGASGAWAEWTPGDAARYLEPTPFELPVVAALSQSGRSLAVASATRLRMLASRERLPSAGFQASLPAPVVSLRHLESSVLALCSDGSIHRVSPATGASEVLARINPAVKSASFSLDGLSLVWVDGSGNGHCGMFSDGRFSHKPQTLADQARSLSILSDGSVLVSHDEYLSLLIGPGSEAALWRVEIEGVIASELRAGKLCLLRIAEGKAEFMVRDAGSGREENMVALEGEAAHACFLGGDRIVVAEPEGRLRVHDLPGTLMLSIDDPNVPLSSIVARGGALVCTSNRGRLTYFFAESKE